DARRSPDPRVPGVKQIATTQTVKGFRKEPVPGACTLGSMRYSLKLPPDCEYRIERVLCSRGTIVGGVYVERGHRAIAGSSAIRGDVNEAMNYAAVMKLPVIFISNNNAYAYSTPTKLQYAVKDLSVRGPAYGMPGVTIDGNDVLAVYATVAKAIALARSGGGPTFIECKTFRMTGHSAHDAA